MSIISNLKDIKKYNNAVLVYGHFSSLHHGHIRFLRAAKEKGDKLIVALMGDDSKTFSQKMQFNQEERASILDHIELIDCIVLLDSDEIDKAVMIIQPELLIFGKEFEFIQTKNIEKAIKTQKNLKKNVEFLVGDTSYASTELLDSDQNDLKNKKYKQFCEAIRNQNISSEDLISDIESIKNSQLIIIGDLIIDQYSACDPLGISSEAPVMVVKELTSKNFLGGAAIVASHVKSLGAEPILISVIGEDSVGNQALNELKKIQVNNILIRDPNRPTTFKKRYIVENQKLFRVSKLDEKSISSEIENKIIKALDKHAQNCKGIIISDFVYGVITPKILSHINYLSEKYNIFLFGDLQCSSQVGEVTKFKDFSVIFPNEKEARIALKDKDSGLEIICQKLIKNTRTKSLILKLGAEGLIAFDFNNKEKLIRQAFPSLSVNPIDVSGAGDSLIALMSTCICNGSTIMRSAALGCCMSSIAVQNMGNKSIKAIQVKEKLFEVLQNF